MPPERQAEATDLLRILDGCDDEVYDRYRRWWARMPEGTDRLFPG